MANIIQIKRGENAPTVDVLEDYELGYCTDEKALYINDSGTIRPTGLPLSGGNITGSLTIQGNNIYHEGNKPTASDVGALSTSGGTLTGSLAMTGTLSLPAGGITKIGKYIDFIEEDEVDYSTRLYSNNGILNSTGEININGNQVYHTGNKSVLEHITETDDITYPSVDIDTNLKLNGEITSTAIELRPNEGSTHGGYIDFHYGGENVDYTSRIFEYASGQIGVYGDLNVNNSIKINSINIFELVYPIGSIYMSVNSTNPSTLFGGTWTAWGSGRVPVGINTSDEDFSTTEKTGGEKTHTLSIAEMPSHTHGQVVTAAKSGWEGVRTDYTGDSSSAPYPQGVDTYSAGGGQAHNNLQPYITCYMWKRTA